MAGRVQILAKGHVSDQLLNNPSFSFFTKKISKYTNWSGETFKMTFNEDIRTDDFIDAIIIPAKYGDVLKGVTLSFKVEGSSRYRYIFQKFAVCVIDYVELSLGDQLIDTITEHDIFIYNELNISNSQHGNLNSLHQRPSYTLDYGLSSAKQEFRVHIPFYFHNRPKHGFPLYAVNKQELKLRIKLRTARELLFPGITTAEFKLENFTVELNLVHLDKTERCKLQSKPFNMLIEQHQHNTFYIEPGSKYGEFRLDFKNPIKEMYFIAKSNDVNPLTYSQQDLVTLECDGVKILNEVTGNSKFLAYSIPHVYHKRSPVDRHINVYSFALQPDKLEPSGHLDFSVIKDAKLTMSLTNDDFKEVRVIAKSYNVIHFENGTGKILF